MQSYTSHVVVNFEIISAGQAFVEHEFEFIIYRLKHQKKASRFYRSVKYYLLRL